MPERPPWDPWLGPEGARGMRVGPASSWWGWGWRLLAQSRIRGRGGSGEAAARDLHLRARVGRELWDQRNNHEVFGDALFNLLYQVFLISGFPSPKLPLRLSVRIPAVRRGQPRITNHMHASSFCEECVFTHGPAWSRLRSVALVCLKRQATVSEEGSGYFEWKLVLTSSELLVPPPPSLIASLVLIEGLSHASALAVWSELPLLGEISLCPSPSQPSPSPPPWNCPPRSSQVPGHLPASLWPRTDKSLSSS